MAGEEIVIGEGLGAAIGGAIAGIMIFLIILGIAVYVYFALALQSIGKKYGYKRPWFAWIPFLNGVMILEMGGFHWAWIFLAIGSFIPVVGVFTGIALAVLAIISFWRIFEKAGYAGALSLLLIVPIARLIMIGIVAWEKKKYPMKPIKRK